MVPGVRKGSLRSADAFPVVASLPRKIEREATTGNASALRRLSKGKRKGILHAREARRAGEEGGKGNFRPFFRGFYFLLIACKTLVCVSVLFCFVCFSEKNFIQRITAQHSFYPGGSTPRNSLWGCAARFSKSCPYFRPKSVIFHTRFQTRPLKSIPVFRPGLLAETILSLLRLERKQKNSSNPFRICMFLFLSYSI